MPVMSNSGGGLADYGQAMRWAPSLYGPGADDPASTPGLGQPQPGYAPVPDQPAFGAAPGGIDWAGQYTDAQRARDQAVQAYNDWLTGQHPQFQMPQQQHVGGKEAGIAGALSLLGTLFGARPQYTMGGLQGYLGTREGQFADDWKRKAQEEQFRYQAASQADQRRGEALRHNEDKSYSDLASLGAIVQRDQANQRTTTARMETAKLMDKRQRELAAIKDPVAQANAIIEESKRAAMDENSPFYGNVEGAMKFYGANQYYKIGTVDNTKARNAMDLEKLQPTIDEIKSRTKLNDQQAAKYAMEIQWYPKVKQADIAKIYSDIDNTGFEQSLKTGQFTLDQLTKYQATLSPELSSLEGRAKEALDRYSRLSDMLAKGEVDPRAAKRIEDEMDSAADEFVRVSKARDNLQSKLKKLGDAMSQVPRPKAPAPQNGANGRLSSTQLRTVAGTKVKASPEAADALERMIAAAREAGLSMPVTDGYRDYAAQVSVKARKPGLAATPGKSQHGWGNAFDIDVGDAGSPLHKWLVENAGRFGFSQPPSLAKKEPWHWEFRGV